MEKGPALRYASPVPLVEKVVDAVPTDPALTDAERRAILAIAVVAVGSDRVVHRDEIAVLERIARRLGIGAELELNAVFADLGKGEPSVGASARLHEAARHLESASSREIAYTTAYAISVADLDANEKESAFHRELAAALSLPEETAKRLASHVVNALLSG